MCVCIQKQCGSLSISSIKSLGKLCHLLTLGIKASNRNSLNCYFLIRRDKIIPVYSYSVDN